MGTPETNTPDADLPDEAWLVALADLPKMGPKRLLALIRDRTPSMAWQAVRNGEVLGLPEVAQWMGKDPAGMARDWRSAAATARVGERWEEHCGITVAAWGNPGYPEVLIDDLEPPAVVFLRGDPGVLDGVRVAVVGTRRCTRSGFEIARAMGHDLAKAGVRVVSGLALGVDGAAHRGALDAGSGAAPPIGVVASGLDVVYPKRHRALWQEVTDAGGLLLSECPIGTRPETWRFPARNRIIAALADAVVVIESPGKGGSMYTVEQAMERSVPVLAVPGPVRSPASAGTNQLIFDGAQMARDADDVLLSLGLSAASRRSAEVRPRPSTEGRQVLRALGWEPATLSSLVIRTGMDLGPLSVAVSNLEGDGWITRQGLWLERVGTP